MIIILENTQLNWILLIIFFIEIIELNCESCKMYGQHFLNQYAYY